MGRRSKTEPPRVFFDVFSRLHQDADLDVDMSSAESLLDYLLGDIDPRGLQALTAFLDETLTDRRMTDEHLQALMRGAGCDMLFKPARSFFEILRIDAIKRTQKNV